MSSEQPFQIDISPEQIAQLKQKLSLTVFPDELEEAGWPYGAPLGDIKRLVARWSDGFDWQAQEAAINADLPQFTRDIEVDGFGKLNIHYVHKKSTVTHAIPLLFVHGWPGSFLEVRKLLPLLTDPSPDHPSFHVVTFSLPGYGFSEAPNKKGFYRAQYAEVGNKVMLALGYNEYVTQGGDWGHIITRKIALDYWGKHSRAWHTNLPRATPPHAFWNPLSYLGSFLPWAYTEAEKADMMHSQTRQEDGTGYMAEQSTRPQTFSYPLADSPAGLLAWIYEKLLEWTDAHPFTDDEVLTWISIYWFSRAGPAASLRIYYELMHDGGFQQDGPNPTIPMGVAYFPKEIVNLPRAWMRRQGSLVFSNEYDKGGYFAAFELPEQLAGDLRKMFECGGPAFGVVPDGKTGYADTSKL
ncbi:alpha/beta-hydrolase [Athelia psychrophila]|uniref:Alpha/beta-hydrolase n=1 Tax=Athelia psychrophila TaxID=1759441 RepID=A0A166H8K1_9AGAM|nr:alpha/beta-hydrolase [Fibularhizoctonia sp. CBS 109695]